MKAYYDSHFGPVPIFITKVDRYGARWEIQATVEANSVGPGKPVYPKGRLILASEKVIFPRNKVILTENGNIAATYVYDPSVEFAEFLTQPKPEKMENAK